MRYLLALLFVSIVALGCGDDDSGTDSGTDSGADAEADSGADAEADTAADSGADAEADSGADANTDGGEDATVDAGECATAMDGERCEREGASCGGPCTDECSFCNILSCREGMWERLEVFPVPCFACGDDTRCVQDEEYCVHQVSDVGGMPDMYSCRDKPAECAAEASCACIAATVAYDECNEDGDGVIVTFAGG